MALRAPGGLESPLKRRIQGGGLCFLAQNLPYSGVIPGPMQMPFATIRIGAVCAALAGAALVQAAPAAAQQGSPPDARAPAGMAPRPAAPPSRSVKYEDTASRRSFVLDWVGNTALLKFDDSPEVHVLRPSTAQRGDSFLRSDSGQLVLRATELGNVISYIGNKNGAPADMVGAASPLDTPAMSLSLSEQRIETVKALSELAGREVTVFGVGAFSNHGRWAADALMVLTLGVERASKINPEVVESLEAVRLEPTSNPVASYRDGELVLGVNPAAGYAGRPSSEAIARAMTEKPK